jgi:hypothetical protein
MVTAHQLNLWNYSYKMVQGKYTVLYWCILTKIWVCFSTEFFPFLSIWLRRFDKTPFMKIQRYGDKILGLWWPHIRLTYETTARKWTKVNTQCCTYANWQTFGFSFQKNFIHFCQYGWEDSTKLLLWKFSDMVIKF